MRQITKKDIEEYAVWVLNDCTDPHDEIEWLVETILNSNDWKSNRIIKEVIADVCLRKKQADEIRQELENN